MRGADGINGMNGIDGLRGADGAHGTKGIDGSKGEIGAVGPQGDKGEAGMIWRGTYRSDIEYWIGDVVGVSGSAYVCVAATNQAPPVGFGWELLVSRGAQGIRGIQGETGSGSAIDLPVSILNGGTGQTTAKTAINALLPSQVGKSGKFLSTEGVNLLWADQAVPASPDADSLTGTTLASTVVTSSLTSTGTLASLTVTAPISGSITGSAATATSATTAGTVTTAAQPAITSVGTLTGLTVTNTIVGSINGNAATATSATSATTAGTVTTAAQPTITSVGTLTAVNTSGVITGTNTTASTTSATGALIIAGGAGIAKDSFINGHRIGVGLLASQTNLAVGTNALNSTIALGIDNVAVGYLAGQNVTSGANNVMLGSNAGFSNTSGASNMCIGNGAHYSNQTGSFNVAIGGGAGHEQNNNSVYNVFLGSNAGYFITSGNETTCVGGDAGRRQADGSTNMTASSNSVYIGYNAKGFNNSDSNTIVIGSNAIGLGANKTAIGTSSTTETKLFGQLTLDATALISSTSATALAIKSAVPAGTGVTPTVQIICPSAAFTLQNQIATQAVFNTGMRTITLQAATTYMFEGQYLLTTGTTSHITSMSFVLTTATMTNCSWTSTTGMPAALNAATSGAFQAIFNSVAGGNVNTASTSANTMIIFKGIMRVLAAGTLVPNIAFSAAPGVTCSTSIGSYIKFYPIGANTIDSVGTAIS
jgi:hypothetical protein